MNVTQSLPVISSSVVLLFSALVFRRYIARGGAHLLLWGIGLAMFGVSSLAEVYSAGAWHPTVFRLWYLGGAVLNAAWLGQGTVYLLRGQHLPNVLISLVLGYAVASGVVVMVGRLLGVSPGILGLLVAIAGFGLTLILHRRWVYRWNSQRLAMGLTLLLVAGSLLATYFVFSIPLNDAHFDVHQTLSAQYRELLPQGATIRRLTPVFNIYGLLTIVGGALYSAWLLWRKEIAPHRVVGNLFIALGALSLAFASTLVRFGLGDYLYVGELVAATLMFAGFVLATTPLAATRHALHGVDAS